MVTPAKKPLPSLRFIIYAQEPIELIPHTNRKGIVTPGYWCVPGGTLATTKELSDRCKAQGYRHAIVGDDNTNLRRQEP